MPIDFTCLNCGEEMNVDERYAGTSGPCRSCGATITIPGAPPSEGYAPARPSSRMPVVAVLVSVLAIVLVCVGILAALLMPAVTTARDAARRAQCQNNMRQIELALVQYESVEGHFPPAFVSDDNGNPMHSWRVLILPYLGEQALYDRYDFQLPWNSANNQAVTQSAPRIFQCSSDTSNAGTSNTNYVGVTGPNTAFPSDGRFVRVSDVADGVSNTAHVVEISGAGIHWAQPTDLPIAQLPSASSRHSKMNVAFMDGHVTTSARVTPSMVIINDGK